MSKFVVADSSCLISLSRIGKLDVLRELFIKIIIPEAIKEAVELTVFAVRTRYPGSAIIINKRIYEKSLKTAEYVLSWVKKQIKVIEKSRAN